MISLMIQLGPGHVRLAVAYGVAAVAVGTAVGLIRFYERKRERRRAECVTANLRSRCCSLCQGPLGDWDGRYHPGRVHFDPGGCLSRISVRCKQCSQERIYYVQGDGFLIDRDVIFQDLPLERREAL
jgi:hypothetical protein